MMFEFVNPNFAHNAGVMCKQTKSSIKQCIVYLRRQSLSVAVLRRGLPESAHDEHTDLAEPWCCWVAHLPAGHPLSTGSGPLQVKGHEGPLDVKPMEDHSSVMGCLRSFVNRFLFKCVLFFFNGTGKTST